MYNSAKKLSGARLFFNCANNTWYQNDIDQISEIIKNHRKNRHIRFYGISMGGYACVLFGCMFPFARSISFSPNLIMRTPFTHSWYYNFNSVKAYSNLINILLNRKPKNISIFFGVNDIIDMYYYGLAKLKNVSGIHAIKSSHSTAAYLDRHELLIPFMRGEINDADLEKYRVYPDPHVCINRFYQYCSTVRTLSALSEQEAKNYCHDLDKRLFNTGILQKLSQDLAICGFTDSAEGIIEYCSDTNIFDKKTTDHFHVMIARAKRRHLAAKEAPLLPKLADEIDGHFIQK